MINYKTLENTEIEIVHDAFLKAFSDYQIDINLPISKFKKMIERRGYVSKFSVGAFNEDDTLVGFILNGVREWNGRKTLYDTGTGTIKAYRKQGVTSTIFLKVLEILKEREVEQYLLEVIQDNEAAVKLYRKHGFEISREFLCLKLDKDKYNPIENWKVEHIDKINSDQWKILSSFWDVMPSWQNSIDSINAAGNEFIYSIVYYKEHIIGYGVIENKTGDIVQIAVSKDYRRKGIGRSIVTDLLKNTEASKISILNVENKCMAAIDFFLKLGFEYNVSQYEMILK